MQRCLLVSNRLPLAFDTKLNDFIPSSGGLVSAIKNLDSKKIGMNFEWIGLLTDDIPKDKINEINRMDFKSFRCHSVVVKKKTYDDFYNLFCNNVLWPLFHYERNFVRNNAAGWQAYKEINEIVAKHLTEYASEEDIIWIHDFHLFLLPGIIKKIKPKLRIGFFLHIPFPSFEIFRELPQRKEIIESLILCDQIGFHDLSYLNHFKNTAQRIVSNFNPQYTKWGVYPISIDVEYFNELREQKKTQSFLAEYKNIKNQKKWILGVDRLDYIKGLILKLKAFKDFLIKHPEDHGKIQLVQVVIPSRLDVPEYSKLKEKLEQLVSSINGEFGSPAWMPIQYLHYSISEQELSALYQISEVLYVGSKRDGMNLVSLEYISSKSKNNQGTILLSEFTGAHSTLSYAISINPWDINDTANKIKIALYPIKEKNHLEIQKMQNFLSGYTSSVWAASILRDIKFKEHNGHKNNELPKNGYFPWMKGLSSKNVLFFCDFDGTLVPIMPHPKDVKLENDTIDILQRISCKKNCEFVVVSGRDKEFLEEQFIDNDFDFSIAACHGAFIFKSNHYLWENLIPNDPVSWKNQVLDILTIYTQRTPESFIEDKGYAVTWHYRNSPKDFSDFIASKLYSELEQVLKNHPAQISKGKKIIEVKSIHANKGYFVQQWIQAAKASPDIVIALGDDTTDEDMFNALQGRKDINSFCIKVGPDRGSAHYHIENQKGVNIFLENLLKSLGD